MTDKAYNPQKIEKDIYQLWEKSGYFNPDNLPLSKVRNSKLEIKNYVVYMPLPNVTGTLHMGHALNNTLQDIIIRYHRMKGRRTLWLPGTDHAGIATQYMVEKELKKEGSTRFKLGREKFIEKIWQWKEKYGDIIFEQLKTLGISADWSRARFTMDKAYSQDVIQAFIHYHKKGLIYRGFRTVNWCPRCLTSLSELELEHEETETKLWYIKYPLVEKADLKYIIVATTRPETMLGDTAVAVNPNDKKYKDLIGREILLPIQNKKIPIVADEIIDPAFGTGAVKVTPAHDITDFEISQRHNLDLIKVIDERGKMTQEAGKSFVGLKTKEAREKVIEILEKKKLLVKSEKYIHNLAQCYRCHSTIEPIPSPQWFLQMKDLAREALEAVKSGSVKIIPKNFEKPYFSWLENIRDWTISRQIWWGHQLPVWFCANSVSAQGGTTELSVRRSSQGAKVDASYIVAIKKPKKCPFCKKCKMEQSEDVLDTWFSSALWPFAGLSKKDVENYYPGNTLITARDIINLWVARMIFSGLEFHKKVPFNQVFINGTILTKEGKRMSKSLGTGVDPLKYIEQHGADATRFGIIWQASGQDIHWDETAIIAGRKFANKIWNASRFVLGQIGNSNFQFSISKPKSQTTADQKIIKDLAITKKKVEKYIEKFELSKALHELYDFFWHHYCDVYLEESKNQLKTKSSELRTQVILLHVLFESLKMLHPFLPFITENIYQKLPIKNKKVLMIEPWQS